MYLLKIQGKLEHISGDLQYDIINSLLIYIRQVVIKARVEDTHLGAESYQKQLNLTEPNLRPPGIAEMTPYKFKQHPFGVVFVRNKSPKFMAYSEIPKFSDQTLQFVKSELDNILDNYNQKRKQGVLRHMTWRRRDMKDAVKFLAKIDERLKFRDQIRRLESYVGGRAPIPNILTFRRPE